MTGAGDDVFVWADLEGLELLGPLADRLRAALQSGQPLVIDLSEAGEPGAAAMQLLIAAARSGDAFVLRNPSRAFVDGCSALGLFAALMAMPLEALP
ncbi:STAS domain-containing protein [Benzoatithermus flavus]|uniref:STAS domain-containing protein n=1 Tax=Benzoatithermus flavus TaxID=3108223 RepID=A0ABU8XUW7_9PROT